MVVLEEFLCNTFGGSDLCGSSNGCKIVLRWFHKGKLQSGYLY